MAKQILINFKGTDNVTKTAKAVETSVKRVGAQSTIMGNQIAFSASKTNKHLTDLGSQLRYMSLVAGLAAAGAVSVAKSFITAARDMQDAQLKLGVFAVSQGVSMDAATQAAQNLYATGLIPLTDASTALSNLLATGMGLDKATKLTNTFLDAIVVAKESINDTFGDALVKATLGVRIFQERQIDATGINTRLDQVYRAHGKTINVVSTNLTNAQKWQAIYNFYMKEGARFTGAADLASQTLSGTMSKLSANFVIMKATLGNALLPAFGTLTEMLRSAAVHITQFAEKFPALASIVIVGTLALTVFVAVLAGLGALIPLVSSGFAGMAGIMGLFSAATLVATLKVVAITLAVGALVYLLLKVTGQWDKWTNTMKNLSQKILETINPMKKQGEEAAGMTAKMGKQIKKLQESIVLATRDFREGMAEWAKAHDETMKDLTKQVQDLDRAYKKTTDNIKKNFSDAMSSLTVDHARKTEDIQQQLAEEVSKGVWADQTKIRSLQKELKRENEDYAMAIAEKADNRDSDLKDEKATYDDKLSELQTRLAAELKLEQDNAKLVADARAWPILDEVEKRQRAYTERVQQLNDEIKEVRANATAEIAANDEVGDSIGGISNAMDVLAGKTQEPITKAQQLQIELDRAAARARLLGSAGYQAGNILKLTIQDLIDKYVKLGQTIYDAGLRADGLAGKIIDTLGGNVNRNISALGGFFSAAARQTGNFFSGLVGYANGGVVPGSPSTPVPIMAHGGETVIPYGKSAGAITININNPVVRDETDLRKIASMVSDVLTANQRFRHLT